MSKYVVVDLEMCRVPKQLRNCSYHWGSETIQIGAVLLDESMEIVDRFVTYVSPEIGAIDTYIEQLTGIRKEDVKGAPKMEEALQMFLSWIPEEAIIVSWSNTDKSQIRHEIEGKNLEVTGMDEFFESWIDCQQTFGEKMDSNRKYKLSEALVIADIDFDERAHDGLIDAYNTALLFTKMQREPKLQLSAYYIASQEDSKHLNTSLGDLFANLNLAAIA